MNIFTEKGIVVPDCTSGHQWATRMLLCVAWRSHQRSDLQRQNGLVLQMNACSQLCVQI